TAGGPAAGSRVGVVAARQGRVAGAVVVPAAGRVGGAARRGAEVAALTAWDVAVVAGRASGIDGAVVELEGGALRRRAAGVAELAVRTILAVLAHVLAGAADAHNAAEGADVDRWIAAV